MISNNSTIVVIPARGGSKRLPGKNIMPLGKHPLIAHSIIYAQQFLDIVDRIYVTTDDSEIAAVARNYGATVVERPADISGDHEPTVSAVKHVLENVADAENVILLQPTNPLRPQELMREAFMKFKSGNYDSLFTVSRSEHKLGRLINDKFIPFNYSLGQRSQDMEPLYFENGLLYISSRKLIFKDQIISEDGYPLVVDHAYANVDIDTAADFDYAKYLIGKL